MRAPRHLPDLQDLLLAFAIAIAAIACTSAPDNRGMLLQPPPPELNERTRALYARTNLEHARALLAEGRLEHAESRTRRGLSYEPDHVELLRLRAEVLEALGRDDEAATVRARADALAPPPAPLPSTPHAALADARATVLLVPPSPELQRASTSSERVPQQWPDGREARSLAERVRTRLPHVSVVPIDGAAHPVDSVPAAAALLARDAPRGAVSIRIDRAYCGHSVKDGSFAVAWLRVAAASPRASVSAPEAHLVRATVDRPPRESCRAAAIGRAVERALELADVAHVLDESAAEPDGAPAYSTAAARTLFPTLASRVDEEVARGRRYLAVGELAQARRHFARAVEIDPDDPNATGFLDEVDVSLALASQIEPGREPAALDPQLSEAQRAGLEAQLSYETDRREEMLSALAVLYETRNAPTPGTVANMRPVEVADRSATGVKLALPRLPENTELEARTLLAPDGAVLARYYFSNEDTTPLLREDDTDADGVADRWLAYEDGLIREVWERHGGARGPTLHVVYTRGGDEIERIELDHNGNGVVDRVFVYAAGVLQDEAWDTNGDGAFDRFQRFDASGSLTMREEDVNGDEQIDVRTAYNNGRVVRREILNDELMQKLQ